MSPTRRLPFVALPGLLLLGTVVLGTATAVRADDVGEARRLVAAGRLEEAEARLESCAAAGTDPTCLDLLGVVLARGGRPADAAKAFRRAWALAPEDFGVGQRLARSLLVAGDEGEGLALLQRLAARGELARDLALKLAVAALGAGRTDAAAVQLESLIARFDSVRARVLLARLRLGGGDAASALALLGEARARAPHAEDVLRLYARAALEAARPLAALGALEPLLRMAPDEPEYVYLAGIARLQVGDAAGAAEVLRRARSLPGPRALPLAALGLALNQLKAYDEARGVLRESLQLDPDGVEALAALAETEEGAGNLDDAAALASRALERKADHPVANLVAGMVHLEQGDLPAALEALRRAEAADPGSPKVHYQLSLVYSRLGDRAAAQEHLERYRDAQRAIEAVRASREPTAASPPAGDPP